MDDYINRNVIVHMLMNIPNTSKQTFDVICNAPAENVAPVAPGHWEKTKNPAAVKCSVCGVHSWVCFAKERQGTRCMAIEDFTYCPFCGAKMHGSVKADGNQ